MKHIKTYESFNLSELKTYIVFKYYKDSEKCLEYFIDSIQSVINGVVRSNILYKYQEEDDKLEELESDFTSTESEDNYLNDVIFSSDDLDECLNFIRIYIKTQKYNL